MIKDLKKVVILNAGHWEGDPGASANGLVEAEETIKVRDRVIPILERHGVVVHPVPDQLDLKKSIAWANEKAPTLNDALAIGIHFNFLSNPAGRGSEAFYGKTATSKEIATAMTTNVSREMGIPDRGAKPDTETAVGSLGWIRNTKMWATLVEICFLTNQQDIQVLQGPGGYEKAATGVAKAALEVLGIPFQEAPTTPPAPEETLYVTNEEGKRLYKLTKL